MTGFPPHPVGDWRKRVISQRALIIECLAAHYPIKALLPLEGPYWNAAFRAVVPEGNCFVKVFNEETSGVMRTVDDLEVIATVLDNLHDVGFRTLARPKRSRSGRAAFRCGPYLVMVFEWIEGAKASLDESNAQSFDVIAVCAPVLARMHEAGRRVQFMPQGLVRREVPYAFSPAQWVNALDGLWLNAERNIRERGYGSATLLELRRARSLCEKLVTRRSGFFDQAAAQHTILHGDFRPENLVQAIEPFVIDFDMVQIGPPEVDIAYASLCFSGPRWFMGPRALPECAAFVRAYRDCSGTRFPESQCLSAAFEYVILKAASLSFKEEQLLARLALYRHIQSSLDLISDESSFVTGSPSAS